MVEIKTKLDENATKEITNFQMKKIWWLYLLFSLIFILLGVLTIIEDPGMIATAVVFIVIGVLFTPLCILLTKGISKSNNKSSPLLKDEIVETYKFDDDKFSIEQTKGDTFKSFTESEYSYIYMVKETDKYWLLYISTSQVHLLPKDKITEGSVEELNDIFKQKLEDKFSPCKKNK